MYDAMVSKEESEAKDKCDLFWVVYSLLTRPRRKVGEYFVCGLKLSIVESFFDFKGCYDARYYNPSKPLTLHLKTVT